MKNFAWLFIFILPGCLDLNDNSSKPETNPFFDLKAYFKEEVTRLENLQNVKKITNVNGNEEVLNMETIDLKSELKIFSDSDINRPAWTDKYAIDSLKTANGQLKKLSYTANDEKLKTKKIEIDFEHTLVSKIMITKDASSAISSMNQLLTYHPKEGYLIERRQDVVLAGQNEFKVEVQFYQ